MAPFLGTGCGRSGTLWTAEFFTLAGVTTLHETQFGPIQQLPFHESEVSWMAMPFLGSVPAGTKVLRIVRDPYAVVISGMQMHFQKKRDDSRYDKFLSEHRPDIVEPDDKLSRIIRWACTWDTPMDGIQHLVIRPDVDGTEQLVSAIEYAAGVSVPHENVSAIIERLGTKVNTRKRSVFITREDIDAHPEGWRVSDRAERFGYV